jgi:hypothetical protein
MNKREKKLFIKEKLLIVIHSMSLKQERTLKYEDVYVKAFKKYPSDFQLIGYPKYPDTELMSKKIYDLRKNGLVRVNRKFITITQKGRTLAEKLIDSENRPQGKQLSPSALSRDIRIEIDRIRNTDAFRLFLEDKREQIVDSDFFAYLGTTVRTDRSDFAGRIRTLEDVVKAVRNIDDYKIVTDMHTYLFKTFEATINAKLGINYPRRKHD